MVATVSMASSVLSFVSVSSANSCFTTVFFSFLASLSRACLASTLVVIRSKSSSTAFKTTTSSSENDFWHYSTKQNNKAHVKSGMRRKFKMYNQWISTSTNTFACWRPHPSFNIDQKSSVFKIKDLNFIHKKCKNSVAQKLFMLTACLSVSIFSSAFTRGVSRLWTQNGYNRVWVSLSLVGQEWLN